MSGMDPGLLNRLRKTLIGCSAFASNAELRACFIDARIHPWLPQLPEADNLAQRVDAVIAYLYDKKNQSQENALFLLLHVLAEREDPADDRHQALLDLTNILENTPAAYDNLAVEISQQGLKEEPTPAGGVSTQDRRIAAGKNVIVRGSIFQGDIYGNVTQVFKSMPAWLQYLLWGILGIALITLLGVVLLLADVPLLPQKSLTPTPVPPETSQFVPIDSSVTDVHGLIYQHTAEHNVLWVRDMTTLYRLDMPLQAKGKLEKVYTLTQRIVNFTLDCRDNIWFALKDGTVNIYNPYTEVSVWLDSGTVSWLGKKAVQDIETRCTDEGFVEVWLAHQGVRTLRYHSPYTSAENIESFTDADDEFYTKTQEFADTVALYLEADNLWGIDRTQKALFRIPFNPLDAFENKPLDDVQIWRITGTAQGTIWVTGDENLFKIDGHKIDEHISSISLKNTIVRAIAASTDGQTVWLGSNCPPQSKCIPLAWYPVGSSSTWPLDLPNVEEVRDIVIDDRNRVWLGTKQGVVCYPKSDCQP